MVVHCLFEQSGTFKNEFKKLGFEAYDYDIENQFGQTDYQIDLFAEIRKGAERERSIFDNFTPDDLIIAFFPCVRFTDMVLLTFIGGHAKGWSVEQKLKRSKELGLEQGLFYDLFCSLFLICIERNLQLIVENPYSDRSYLTMHFPIKPAIIDYDRRILGDKWKKPTQYWFLNIDVKNNKVMRKSNAFTFGYRDKPKDIKHVHGIDRSLIEPEYAKNFIKKYIL